MSFNCYVCKESSTISNVKQYYIDRYHRWCCSNCITKLKKCKYCRDYNFRTVKYKNIELWNCPKHIPKLILHGFGFKCHSCSGISGYSSLHCCENCQLKVLCEKCVLSKTRRAFDSNGKVFCKDCEPDELLCEYKMLWMFKKQYVEREIDCWGEVLGLYVKLFLG